MYKTKLNIYLAGPLFSEAEIQKRKEHAFVIKNMFQHKYDVSLYNPVELNETVKDLKNKPNIFFYENDIDFIKKTNLMIVDIDNLDSGTMIELGYFTALKEINKSESKYIFIYDSDWRNHLNRSARMNKFLDGLISTHCIYVKSSRELFEKLKEVYKL